MARSAAFLPALIRFSGELAREDGWGRLTELSAQGAAFSTQTPLAPLEKVFLFFEVNGERFKELSAVVERSETDPDGFYLAELSFSDEVEKRRLARTLLDLLSR